MGSRVTGPLPCFRRIHHDPGPDHGQHEYSQHRATPRDACQNWLRKAKAAWLADTPDAEREKLEKALHRVGLHAEKRQGIRDPEFRKLPPKIQEEFSGTSWEMIRRVYDEVTVDDMREAMGLERGANCEQQLRATG